MERDLGKMLRMCILQIVFVVMFVGFSIIPANAATTSTAPRIYSDFVKSPAYKNYTDFAKLYVSKYSIAIPGLEHTDVNGKDCTTMVPQGICFAKDYLIVSAYDSAEKYNSVLYVISNDDGRNRKLLMTLVLPMKAHVGGIAFDGTYLWVANGRNVSSIQYSTLVSKVSSAVADKKQSVSISFHSTCTPATGAAFLTYGEGMLWVGQFKDKGDTSGKMYSYEVSKDGKKLTKKYCIQLPDRIQGACFKDGYLILSRSYSRNVSGDTYISELRIYKISRPDQDGKIKKNSVVKVIKMPPMIEGVVAGKTYMYAVYESAATKYYKGNDGKGTCKYPVDRIVAFKFSDFIDLDNSDYFKKCDTSYESIAKALDSIGVDGSKTYRAKIAKKNGINGYTGTAEQNIKMLDLLKAGKLLKPELLLKVDERLVCFDANGGTGVMPEEVLRNGAVLPNNNFARTGYQFAGWATTADGEVVYGDNACVNLVESVTFYAVWEEVVIPEEPETEPATEEPTTEEPTTEEPTTEEQETESATEESTTEEQETESATEEPTTEEQETESTTEEPTTEEQETESATEEPTTEEQETEEPTTQEPTTEEPETQEPVDSIYFEKCDASYESIAKALASIGVDGSKTYRLKIAEKNGIANYTGTAEQNITMLDLLKAGKLLKPELLLASDEYLVCFDANAGTGSMKEVVLKNGTALPKNIFTKKGHIFAGWATTADGAVVYSNKETVTLTESITLYAVWKPNQYILVYDANGGSGTMSNTTVTYGVSTAVRKPTFTRKGYTVAGWYRYRTSDNKWYYTSADGKISAWYVEGKQPTGYKKQVMKTTGTVSVTSAVAGDKVVLYAVWEKDNNYISLDGKKVMFIGNSFIYYGGVVENGSQKKTDKGWFYQICKSNGENVSVYDCTYGGHHLYDFTTKGCKSGSCHKGKDLLAGAPLKSIDYVFISESGNNNANFIKDVKAVMKRFPSKTKFIYLCHSYTYSKNHKKILNKLSTLEDMGVSVVEWGKLVDDVIDGRTKVSGATVKYKKNTFIKNKGDTYHPNPLAGYITAQMAYCAVTGRSAVEQMPDVYKIGNDVKYGKSAVGYSKYISKHYKSSSSSNFKTVLKSKADIIGLQKLMDKYLAKRNLGINAKK